ncbi:MAG: sigma-54-dependent transcriptional regulator [Pyrinomonadaceae bacterium]
MTRADDLLRSGRYFAQTGLYDEARAALEQAARVFESESDFERAGLAQLEIIEVLFEHLNAEDIAAAYELADSHLEKAGGAKSLERLRACARKIIVSPADIVLPEFESRSFIHASKSSAELIKRARRYANTGRPILVTGESGTGKECLARQIHSWHGGGTFQVVACSSVPDGALITHLDRPPSDTVYLKEVAELTVLNLNLLLKAVRGRLKRKRPAKPKSPRLIFSSSRDLSEEVRLGRFLSDLYGALRQTHLVIPPLRERPDDIPALANHFIADYAGRYKKSVEFTPEAIRALRSLPLRGNARELRSLIELTFASAESGTRITESAVDLLLHTGPREGADLAKPLANRTLTQEMLDHERRLITIALESSNGNISLASRQLGIGRANLSRILQTRQKGLLEERLQGRPPAKGEGRKRRA